MTINLLMMKRQPILLSPDERATLEEAIRLGEGVSRRLQRARMILASADGKTDQEIAESLKCGERTVGRTRARYLLGGIEAVLQDGLNGIFRGTVTEVHRFTDAQKDAIVRLASSPPPKASERWTLQSLADYAVNLGIVTTISGESVRRILKEKTNRVTRHRSKIPRSKKHH
jgi:transposase